MMALRKMKVNLDTWCTRGLPLLEKKKLFGSDYFQHLGKNKSEFTTQLQAVRFGIEKVGFF